MADLPGQQGHPGCGSGWIGQGAASLPDPARQAVPGGACCAQLLPACLPGL